MTSKEITEMYYAYVFDLNKDVVLEIAPKCAEGEFLVIKRLAPPSNIPHLFFHLFAPFGFYRYSLIDSKSGEEAAYVSTIRWNPQFDFIHRFGGGLHIGPDATKEKYRGRSFHPYLISYVLREQQTNIHINRKCYMFVLEDNIASIKGIERAGFRRCGKIVHSGYLYQLVPETATIPVVRKSNRFWSKLFGLASKIFKHRKG